MENVVGGILFDLVRIPDNIWIEVFSLLDRRSLLKCRRVSKQWRVLSMDHSLWRNFDIKKFKLPPGCLDFITGEVARDFILCHHGLSRIDLSRCSKISNSFLISLSINCSSLKYLSLEGCNRITDRGVLSLAKSCSSLKYINILDTLTTEFGLIALLEANTDVEELTASAGSLTANGVSQLAQCHKLEALHIESNGWSARLKPRKCRLENLTDEMLMELANGCRNLRVIVMKYDWGYVSNVSLEALRKCCPLLEGVELGLLDGFDFVDEGLSSLARSLRFLQHLDLYDVGASDQTLISLASSCVQLKSLSLVGYCEFTDLGVIELVTSCRELEVLSLSSAENCSITDRSAFCIAKNSLSLLKLIMNSWNITDIGLMILSLHLKSMTHLSLEGCPDVTHVGLVNALRNWKTLTTLDLSSTNCLSTNNELFAVADSLTSIEKLTVYDCYQIDWAGRAAFFRKHPMCVAEFYAT